MARWLADAKGSVLLTLVWWLAIAPMASATDFGSNINHPCDETYASQCVADNYDHQVRFFDVTENMLWGTQDRMQYYNGRAARLLMREYTTGTRDVHVQDLYVGPVGWWAATYCASSATYGGTDPSRWCRPQILTYNLTYSIGIAQPQYMACHELGHTVGLRHYSNDSTCMKNGDTSGWDQILDHERDHINTRYGN